MTGYLTKLNNEQKEAVTLIDKPVIVTAGPGSGKTGVLTSKIAYLISKGVEPEKILALTFTEKAANEMMQRVVKNIKTSSFPEISTFHAFCNEIIKDNLLDLKLNANLKIIEDSVKLVSMLKQIDKLGFEYIPLNTDAVEVSKLMINTIGRLKDELITIPKLKKYLETAEVIIPITGTKKAIAEAEKQNQNLNYLRDVVKAWEFYESYKEKNNFVDFTDLQIKAYHLLKTNKKVLNEYQEKYDYILVDEFQDTDFIQLQIIILLAEAKQKITVVGDPKQSIYRFRGAYLTNIPEFKEAFPNFKEVFLIQNYRSTKNIVSVSNKLMNEHHEEVKDIFTKNDDGKKVKLIMCSHPSDESGYILNEIRRLQEKGIKPSEIAVLGRKRSHFNELLELLNQHNVDYEFVGSSDYFKEPIIKDVIAFLKVLNNPLDNEISLTRMLMKHSFNVSKLELAKLNKEVSKHNWDKNADEKKTLFEHLINKDDEKFVYIKQLIHGLKQHELKLPDLIHKILYSKEFYKHELILDNEHNISLLNQFYKLSSNYSNLFPQSELNDFIDYITHLSKFEVEEDIEINETKLQLLTSHASKGKEYKVVFVIGLNQRKFPCDMRNEKIDIPEDLCDGNKNEKTKDLHIEEERRLFYVAVTRAMERLYLLTQLTNSQGNPAKPSQFLTELSFENNDSIEVLTPEIDLGAIKEISVKEELKTDLMKKLVSAISFDNKEEAKKFFETYINFDEVYKDRIEKGVIEEVKKEGNYSVSQFGSYKRCPRAYKFNYIYHVPSKPKSFFTFGGSIHSVFEMLKKDEMNGVKPELSKALEYLDVYWKNEGYENHKQEKEYYEKAKTLLPLFLERDKKLNRKTIKVEHKFEIDLDDKIISGKIDRIDEDSEGNLYLIDYKTSKDSKEKEEIKTDIQLVVYSEVVNRLFGKYPKSISWWFVVTDEIVETDLTKEESNQLIQEIRDILHKIDRREYPATPENEFFICKNCDYKEICDK